MMILRFGAKVTVSTLRLLIRKLATQRLEAPRFPGLERLKREKNGFVMEKKIQVMAGKATTAIPTTTTTSTKAQTTTSTKAQTTTTLSAVPPTSATKTATKTNTTVTSTPTSTTATSL